MYYLVKCLCFVFLPFIDLNWIQMGTYYICPTCCNHCIPCLMCFKVIYSFIWKYVACYSYVLFYCKLISNFFKINSASKGQLYLGWYFLSHEELAIFGEENSSRTIYTVNWICKTLKICLCTLGKFFIITLVTTLSGH